MSTTDTALSYARHRLRSGDARQAERIARDALRTAPSAAGLHEWLGRSLAAQSRHAEALVAFDAALAAWNGSRSAAAVHGERAQSCRSLGRGDEATFHFERAAELDPDHAERRLLLLLHRGNLFDEQGRRDEALAQFEAAVAAFPESADAWAMLGTVQSRLDPVLAEESLARALRLAPDRMPVMERFAGVLLEQKNFADAALVFERMFELDPQRAQVAGNLLHVKYLLGDWLQIGHLQARAIADLRAGKPAAEPFGVQGWCDDPALLRQVAEQHAAARFPPRPDLLPGLPQPGTGPRIRLGYLCGEFREQATSVLLAEVLELHDRSRFDVMCFDSGWSDGSPRRARIEAACEIVPIAELSDLDAAKLIRKQRIDILVNLNGYFGRSRNGVFSMRAAPVQVNYLGFPGTIGARYIDYLIADATVIPESESRHYVERIVRLQHSYQPNDRTRQIAKTPRTRADAGLPDGAFVFCCLNNAYKIVPAIYDVWMRLLSRVPDSVLLLYGDKPEQIANLRHEAALRGVAPERILFAPPLPNAEHLRRLQLCDLFLDTWPYNAHTTASDALWAGLPVLTLTGRTFASRVGASLLQAVGLPALITHDVATYEALALELATDRGLLRRLRMKLEENVRTAPLYDTPRYTRELETAFEQMMTLARAGQTPRSLVVAPGA